MKKTGLLSSKLSGANLAIPEGQPGSHPALLSRSDKIRSVNILGSLPAKETLQWQGENRVMLV
ncbi:hypothetical protein [Endozoicomonas sp. SESOKO3]|nr:hypothetical protein [Endozoicomonas sp. SESOKO3]